jgi:ribonuclease P protein component
LFCDVCGTALTTQNKVRFWGEHKNLALDTQLKLDEVDRKIQICRKCFNQSKQGLNLLKKNTLNKAEILSLKKVISSTFELRETVTQYPFKIFIKETQLPTSYPAQALFTVPKRNFKLAVDRNLLRRRIKEAYRKNKHELYHQLAKENKQLAIIIIYLHNKEMAYNDIEEKLILSLQKVIKKMSQS